MAKATLLILGTLAYLYALQLGQDAATAGVGSVGNLYTRAAADAAAISAANR